MIFIGNPGTGKTTVAKLMGDVYEENGLLPTGHTIIVNALDLEAKYVGQTAIKVEEVFSLARGGVLFIDEAYALHKNYGGYGKEAINKLIQLMEEYRFDVMVIMAGYESDMDNLINMNPGLKERFSEFIYFDDFNSEELFNIYTGMIQVNNHKLTNGAKLKLEILIKKLKDSGKLNANARSIRNLVDRTFINQHSRLHDNVIFTDEDMLSIIDADIPTDA